MKHFFLLVFYFLSLVVLLYFRCRVVLKVILNMVMDLVLGVVMICNELKDPDKLFHVGCHMALCLLLSGTLKWILELDLKCYAEWSL